MKKFLNNLALQFFLLIALSQLIFAQTNEITVDTLSGAVSACQENRFSATLITATNSQALTISASLDNVNSITCQSASLNTNGVYVQIDSILGSASSGSTNSDTGTWSGSIVTAGAIVVYYHVYIDCAVIDTTISGSTINLIQTFTGASYTVSNGIANTYQVSNISNFRLSTIQPPNFPVSYIDTSDFVFMFTNYDFGSANIKFRFAPDTNNYNSKLQTVGLFSKIGENAPYNPISINTLENAVINYHDTLFVKQRVYNTGCLDSAEVNYRAKAVLKYQCNNPLADSGIFCSDCIRVDTVRYRAYNNNDGEIRLERLSPPDAVRNWDIQCVNDTVHQTHWSYKISKTGPGGLDSLIVTLYNSDQLVNLTVVPRSTFVDSVHCNSCTVVDSVYNRAFSVCDTLMPDSSLLSYATVKIYDFKNTDTLYVSFNTFRCGAEDEAIMNFAKYLNQWQFRAYNYICGTSLPFDTMAAKSLIDPSNGYISTNALQTSGATGDLNLQLNFTPLISDLSIPHDETFGQEASLGIDLQNVVGLTGDIADMQLFDTLATTASLNGYIRAKVHCDIGLRMHNLNNAVRFKLEDTQAAQFIYRYPVYYNSNVDSNICTAGDYYFYFDLADSLVPFLQKGIFEFTLQACCNDSAEGQTKYNVSFYTMPNPNSCYSLQFNDTVNHIDHPICNSPYICAWIPLSGSTGQIATHCPGCKSCGVIVDNYTMERVSFGLQSTNNMNADSLSAQIIPGSSWYNTYQPFLKVHQSSYGDMLEDKLVAHFQDGDFTDGGYTYQQMQDSANLYFPFLQLGRKITNGLDTLKLLPLEMWFYVDRPDTTSPVCIDCADYGVDPAAYQTQLFIHITDTAVLYAHFLDTLTQHNKYMFTFESTGFPGSGGNLYNPAYISGGDSSFMGFSVDQKYRLRVRYVETGNFPSKIQPQVVEDVRKKGEILNRMFVTGKKQINDDNVPQQINTLDSLRHVGITLFPSEVGDTVVTPDSTYILQLMDTSYINSHIFFCEPYGGIHYFYAQDGNADASTTVDNAGCEKSIVAAGGVSIAGGQRDWYPYPYEFRPSSIMPVRYKINIPAGYHATRGEFGSSFLQTTGFLPSISEPFPLPATTGTLIIYDSIFPPPVCLDTATPNDSIHYIGKNLSYRSAIVYIEPDSCNAPSFNVPKEDVVVWFNTDTVSCLAVTAFKPNLDLKDSIEYNPAAIHGIAPHLSLNVDDLQSASYHTVCFPFDILNQNLSTTINSDAPYVFIAVPDSATVPYLGNWYYIPDGGTPIPAINGGIIQLDTLLAIGKTLKGSLCADYISCRADSLFNLSVAVGWDCAGFPSTLAQADSVCALITKDLTILNQQAGFGNPFKDFSSAHYTLCDTFTVNATFNSVGGGAMYPLEVLLDSVPTGLVPLHAILSQNCGTTSGPFDTLTFTSPFSWAIIGSDMTAINYADSSLSGGECINVSIVYLPTCEFAGQDARPDIILHSISLCGAMSSDTAEFQGPFTQDSTICTDCFTLIKNVDMDTATAFVDTVTFTITICGNNIVADTVSLTEYLPAAFTLTDSNYVSNPVVPADSCISFFVSGFFTTNGDCNDGDHTNKVSITTSTQAEYTADTCVAVIIPPSPCIALSDTVFADSLTLHSGTFVGMTIDIAGHLFIDGHVIFKNCTVYTEPGSQITCNNPTYLELINTTFIACTQMWRGIELYADSKIEMTDSSKIYDAQDGIYARYGTNVEVHDSYFLDCVKGISTEQYFTGTSIIDINITGTLFAKISTNFKPDYSGQPYHGKIPETGIELNDLVFSQIGDDNESANLFYNLNRGITAYYSTVTVSNSRFNEIRRDTAYHQFYDGTAIVSIGDHKEPLPGDLTVYPLPDKSLPTVTYSHRGVYTRYSNLEITKTKMLNMDMGVYSRLCKDGMHTSVAGCTIDASVYGIKWDENVGTLNMLAQEDTITVTGANARGIALFETNNTVPVDYRIYGNQITLKKANFGVFANTVCKATISSNFISIQDSAETASATEGISLRGCNSVSAKCNRIIGEYPVFENYRSRGVGVHNSESSLVSCNNVDSTRFGFFFGGFCPQTLYRSNDMLTHFEGLRLNTTAVIDTQSLSGNRWYGPFGSSYGANNFNSTSLSASEILVNPTYTYLSPNVPSLISAWITAISGTNYSCSEYDVCNTSFTGGGGSEGLMKMIAKDSTLTLDFIEESKIKARQYLYKELKNDSLLAANDTAFSNFLSNNEYESTGYLFETDEKLSEGFKYDSAFVVLSHQTDSLIQIATDSLAVIDSLIRADTLSDYSLVRENLIDNILYYRQSFNSLVQQRQALISEYLDEADEKNTLVTPTATPDQNDKIINNVEITFQNEGLNSLVGYYQDILSIANQCPYGGGNSVFKARGFLEMITDSLSDYDDDNLCFLAGIARNGHYFDSEKVEISSTFEIIPNPASESINVRLLSPLNGICKIEIVNPLGEIILKDEMNCKEYDHIINTRKFVSGVYFVKIYLNDAPFSIRKLIIER